MTAPDELTKEQRNELAPDRFWTKLRPHAEQSRFYRSTARFQVCRAGRRSGKTDLAKRKLVRCARHHVRLYDYPGRYFACAPTHDQAREIFWDDLCSAFPSWEIDKIYEGRLIIRLISGTLIRVFGLDKPQRIEGQPIDGIVVDEVDEMKSYKAWDVHVSPGLDTPGREGWAVFIGVPRGLILKDLARNAGSNPDWESFHWTAEDILTPRQIEAAKRRHDPRTYRVEYLASDETATGRAYYTFDRTRHIEPVVYDPALPIALCFDFNVDPGVCAILQEQRRPDTITDPAVADQFTAAIGEVYIEPDSRTERVCRAVLDQWGNKHRGTVFIHGDATGGRRSTRDSEGSDWDIIRTYLRKAKGWQLRYRVPRANPSVRGRINALNTRMLNADDRVHFLVNHEACPKLVRDLEEVMLKDDGRGDIDKDAHPKLTHISDALGYYVMRKFPVGGKVKVVDRAIM